MFYWQHGCNKVHEPPAYVFYWQDGCNKAHEPSVNMKRNVKVDITKSVHEPPVYMREMCKSKIMRYLQLERSAEITSPQHVPGIAGLQRCVAHTLHAGDSLTYLYPMVMTVFVLIRMYNL